MICSLGVYIGQVAVDPSPPWQHWTPKSWHGTCLTLIPWLLVPSQEKSLQILKGASGQAFVNQKCMRVFPALEEGVVLFFFPSFWTTAAASWHSFGASRYCSSLPRFTGDDPYLCHCVPYDGASPLTPLPHPARVEFCCMSGIRGCLCMAMAPRLSLLDSRHMSPKGGRLEINPGGIPNV